MRGNDGNNLQCALDTFHYTRIQYFIQCRRRVQSIIQSIIHYAQRKIYKHHHRRSAHRDRGPAPPPSVFFNESVDIFHSILASLNQNCVQYYNTKLTSVLYCTLQCTLRKLQCKNKLTNTVCANVFSLFTIIVCTVHVLYNLCSISMYTPTSIIVHSYSYYSLQQTQNTVQQCCPLVPE